MSCEQDVNPSKREKRGNNRGIPHTKCFQLSHAYGCSLKNWREVAEKSAPIRNAFKAGM
jgi:hypothetical protein